MEPWHFRSLIWTSRAATRWITGGCARLAVLKSDGTRIDIKGPESLEGKGWAVRSPGWRNANRDVAKLFDL